MSVVSSISSSISSSSISSFGSADLSHMLYASQTLFVEAEAKVLSTELLAPVSPETPVTPTIEESTPITAKQKKDERISKLILQWLPKMTWLPESLERENKKKPFLLYPTSLQPLEVFTPRNVVRDPRMPAVHDKDSLDIFSSHHVEKVAQFVKEKGRITGTYKIKGERLSIDLNYRISPSDRMNKLDKSFDFAKIYLPENGQPYLSVDFLPQASINELLKKEHHWDADTCRNAFYFTIFYVNLLAQDNIINTKTVATKRNILSLSFFYIDTTLANHRVMSARHQKDREERVKLLLS